MPFPQKVMVQTISRCNAACTFCPYPYLVDDLPHGGMDDDLFRRIIDECAQHPGQVERLMPYLMNEPLLDERIVERIDYAKQRNPGASVHILTNGSLLTERRTDALIDSGLDWIGISVHGYSDEAYAQAMGLKREVTYRRVERFIRRAIARRGPGFVMVTFNGGGAVTSRERELELAHFRDLGVQRISYFGRSISRAGNVPIIDAPHNERIRGCRSIWWPEMIHILHSGDVVLCCMDWRRQVVLGNLEHRSIEELWSSDAYQRVREMVAGLCEPDGRLPCLRCEEADVQPAGSESTVDVALVVLPCAVMASDASLVPGIRAALRSLGLGERLVDLSALVYDRLGEQQAILWRRSGHGVLYEGDASSELVGTRSDQVEWCVEQSSKHPAHHLLFPILESNRACVLEVIRRLKERDPHRSILTCGSDLRRPEPLDLYDIPYRQMDNRDQVAAWVADRIGWTWPSLPEPRPDRDHAVPRDPPPWRPPGWQGVGAGMVRPSIEEGRPWPLRRWVDRLSESGRLLSALGRNPILAAPRLWQLVRASVQGLADDLVSSPHGPSASEDGMPTGVPGSIELPTQPRTTVVRTRATPAPQISSGSPSLTDSRPWQRRPDQGRPVDVLLGTVAPWGVNNPPVGLAHLATYARVQGHAVEMLDMNIDLYHRLGAQWELLWHVENKNFWSNASTFELLLDLIGPHLDDYADLIAEHSAPLVGLSVVDPKERCTIELIRRIMRRNPRKRIVLGGPACVTPEYRRIFSENVGDLVAGYAIGEGEQILCDVIEATAAGMDLSGVPGILCHRQGEDLPMMRRERLLPLDRIPFPRYEDFDLTRYPGDELIVEWSRGCTGSCNFCKGKMIDGKHRSHSARAIFEALQLYVEQLGIRRFTVCDPVLNGDPEKLALLSQLIVEAHLEVRWRGEAIPTADLTAELLSQMRQAGCVELQLGLESGSDRVLEAMNKSHLFRVTEAGRVVRDCHQAGIRTALFIIVGFPGESEHDFEQTRTFIRDNADCIDELKSINALHIITGTPLHSQADRWGICLPEQDYHHRWSTADGNTEQVRNERVSDLMQMAEELGIPVRETNLAEDKHLALWDEEARPGHNRADLLALLQAQVSTLRSTTVHNPDKIPTLGGKLP